MSETPQPARPVWWIRQFVEGFTLSEEEAWKIISGPPWRCVFAWATRDCQPVACTMAYVILDGRVVLTSTANRDKIKALRRNPAVCLCFQGKGLKQVTLRGRGELSNESSLIRRWVEAHMDTWSSPPGADDRQRELDRYLSPDRWLIIIHPERMRTFDGEAMFRAEREAESTSQKQAGE